MSRICLIGGAGFIGRNVAELLVRDQHQVVIPTRRRERAKRNLIMLPTVDVVQTDIHDDAALDRLIAGCDAVINCVGVLQSSSGSPYGAQFARAHVELPKRIVWACERQGVRRLLHVSALGASSSAPSEYQRSKGDGERALLDSKLDVTIFQPSVVFGPDDQFLNLFAKLQKLLPVMVIGMPDARFQPVYVEDVARVIVRALGEDSSFGKTYPLVGPTVYSLRELVAYAGTQAGAARPIIGLTTGLAMLQARVMEWLPGSPLSRDNVRSMQVDNVSNLALPFGIKATALESIAPGYLRGIWPRTRYDRYRNRAGRQG